MITDSRALARRRLLAEPDLPGAHLRALETLSRAVDAVAGKPITVTFDEPVTIGAPAGLPAITLIRRLPNM